MNKADLLVHIADYQKNKGWFRKIFPGFQNWWPKVSFGMSRLIRLTNRILPDKGYESSSDFNLFEIKKPFRIELEKIVQGKTWGFTEAIFQSIRTILQREKEEAIADAKKREEAIIQEQTEKRKAALSATIDKIVDEAKKTTSKRQSSFATTKSSTPTSLHSSSSVSSCASTRVSLSSSVDTLPKDVKTEAKVPAVTPMVLPLRTTLSVPGAKTHPTIITGLHYSSDDSGTRKKKKVVRSRKDTDTSPAAPSSAHVLIPTSSTPVPLGPTLNPVKAVAITSAVSELNLDAKVSPFTSPVSAASSSETISTVSPTAVSTVAVTPPLAISPVVTKTSTELDESVHEQRVRAALLNRQNQQSRLARTTMFAAGMGVAEFASALSEGQIAASIPRAAVSSLVYGVLAYQVESNTTLMTMASTLLSLAWYGVSYRTAAQSAVTAVSNVVVNQLFRR